MTLKEKLMSLEVFVDNQYFNKYIELIETNLMTKKQKDVTQSHHIIPRYYFKHNNIDVDNTKENRVNLKYSDHILAHYYLSMCCINEEDRISNISSLCRISRTTLDELNLSKEDLDNYNKMYAQYQELNRKSHLGKKHSISESTKQKISDANKNKYRNWIHIYLDDATEKIICRDELDNYLKDGWSIGRCEKTKKSLSDSIKKCEVKGMMGKHQSDYQKSCVRKYMSNRTVSEESRQKMRDSRKNKTLFSNNETRHSLYIDSSQFEEYILKGYHKGRLN